MPGQEPTGYNRRLQEPAQGRFLLEVSAGFLLILVGIIGLILPVMPGWVFIISGFALLSRHFRWARKGWIGVRRLRVYLVRRWKRRKLPAGASPNT